MQNQYGEEAESIRQESEFHQKVGNEMRNTLYRMLDDELLVLWSEETYRVQAQSLVIEYINLDLNTLTSAENQTYLDLIAFNFRLMELSLEGTWTYFFYKHFELENQQMYTLDVYPELDNYQFELMSSSYFSNTPMVMIKTAEEFLNDHLVKTGILLPKDEYLIQKIIANPYMPLTIASVNSNKMTDMIRDLIFQEVDLADQLAKQARDLETTITRIAIGVSITTIASILTVAMGNRLENKETEQQFARIRKNQNDEEYFVIKRDTLAVLVLLLAAIITLIGVLLPILLGSQLSFFF